MSFQPFRLKFWALLTLGAAVYAFSLTAWVLLPSFGANDMRDLVRNLRAFLPAWAIPLGWLAVWALRTHSPDSVLVGPAPARPRSGIVTRQIGLLVAAVTLGTALGFLPVSLVLTSTQYSTPTDWVSLLGVVAAVGSLVPLAAAAATLVGVRAGLFVAPAALLLVMVGPVLIQNQFLTSRGFSVDGLAYVSTSYFPLPGFSLSLPLEMARIAFFVLVGAVGLLATIGLAEWKASRRAAGLVNLAWCALPIAALVAVAAVSPKVAVPDPNDSPRCARAGLLNLCLHQIDEQHRPYMEKALLPAVEVFGREVTITQKVHFRPGEIPISRAHTTTASWLSSTLRSVAVMLLDPAGTTQTCNDKPFENGQLRDSVERQVLLRAAASASDSEVASAYTAATAETLPDEAADRAFGSLSADEFRAWLGKSGERYQQCNLTAADLPA